jgi:hypothetical protein
VQVVSLFKGEAIAAEKLLTAKAAKKSREEREENRVMNFFACFAAFLCELGG